MGFFVAGLASNWRPATEIQGILIGFGLAVITAQAYAWVKATKKNGWISTFGLGVPDNGSVLYQGKTFASLVTAFIIIAPVSHCVISRNPHT